MFVRYIVQPDSRIDTTYIDLKEVKSEKREGREHNRFGLRIAFPVLAMELRVRHSQTRG